MGHRYTQYLQFIPWTMLLLLLVVAGCGGGGATPVTLNLDEPATLSASRGTYADRIEVTWTPVAGATGYQVQAPGTYEVLAELGDVTTWADTDLGDDVLKRYRILATDGTESIYIGSVSGYRQAPAGPAGGSGGPGSWRCEGGVPGRRGHAACAGPGYPAMLWEYPDSPVAAVRCSPLVADDGTAYLGFSDRLVALDTATGETRWQVGLDSPVDARLTTGGQVVVLLANYYTGYYLALFNPDGSLAWAFDLSELIDTSITSTSRWEFLCNDDGLIYLFIGYEALGISLAGEVLWQLDLPWYPHSSHVPVTLDDGSAVVTTHPGNLAVLTPGGEIAWQLDRIGNDHEWAQPIVTDDGRILCTLDGRLQIVAADGTVVNGIAEDGQTGALQCVDDNGIAYLIQVESFYSAGSITTERHLVAVDLTSLETRWSLDLDEIVSSVITCAGGNIYLDYGEGLAGVSAGGELLWEYFYDGIYTSNSGNLAMGPDGLLIHVSVEGTVAGFREADAVPVAPQNLTASQGLYNDAISLHWDHSPSAEYYAVYRDGAAAPLATDIEVTHWVDAAPVSGEHSYTVAAGNRHGTGGESNPATGTTAATTHGPYWTQCKGDPARTSHSSESGPLSPTRLWEAAEGSGGWNTSIYVGMNGMVYNAGDGLRAYSPEGVLEWERNVYLNDDELLISPEGLLYYRTYGGENVALTAYGAEVDSGVPAEDRLLAFGPDGARYVRHCLDEDAGEYLLRVTGPGGDLRYEVPVGSISNVSVSGTGMVCFSETTDVAYNQWSGQAYWSKELVALGPAGDELWRFDPTGLIGEVNGTLLSAACGSAPLITSDGSVYVNVYYYYELEDAEDPRYNAAQGGFRAALDNTGNLRWNRDLTGLIAAAPDNGLYAVTGNVENAVTRIDRDGNDIWVAELAYDDLAGGPDSLITDSDYNVFVKYNMAGCGEGAVVGISSSGAVLWNTHDPAVQIEWGSMAMGAGGTLYYVEEDGPLVALGTR